MNEHDKLASARGVLYGVLLGLLLWALLIAGVFVVQADGYCPVDCMPHWGGLRVTWPVLANEVAKAKATWDGSAFDALLALHGTDREKMKRVGIG